MANAIVSRTGEKIMLHGIEVNPTGYQNVLIVTGCLYIVALCLSIFFVKPIKKDK